MTVSTMTSTPKVVGIYESVRRPTSQERLMLARLLLDSVLSEEVDDHADWTALGFFRSFEQDWDNPEDAIYDQWRVLYGLLKRGDVVLIPFPYTDLSAVQDEASRSGQQ